MTERTRGGPQRPRRDGKTGDGEDRPDRPKRTRVDFRLPPTVRRVIELAAHAAGETLTLFVIRAALSRARVHVHDPDIMRDAEQELEDKHFRYLR